jgi:hypothetical protein
VATPDSTVVVRATINLSGLRRGHVATVDPADPWVARLLIRQILVPV